MKKVEADLENDLFRVTTESSRPSLKEMLAAIRKLGYGVEVVKPGGRSAVKPVVTRGQRAQGPVPAVIQEALDRAKEAKKFLIVDFHASWCPACKRMFKETWENPRVAKKLGRFVFLPVDTDEHPEASRYFGVRGIPDARILAPDGAERARIFDFQNADAVLKVLRGVR